MENKSSVNNNVVGLKAKKNKKRFIPQLIVAASLLVLAVGVLFAYRSNVADRAVDFVVGIDVNPSIEIDVSPKEKVLDIRALNNDAEKILSGMDLKGAELDVAVNALIGSMVRNGYISEIANSILVTVENDDASKGAELEQRMLAAVSGILSENSVEGAVVVQAAAADDELKALAEKYNISVGKARFIQNIINSDTTFSFEALADMNINDLNLLTASRNVELADAKTTGTASAKSYITSDKARETALNHAGFLNANPASFLGDITVRLDLEDGRMVYEVEFAVTETDATYTEYGYDIDAVTGEVVKHEKETKQQNTDDDNEEENPQQDGFISGQKAMDIALSHAGLAGRDGIRDKKAELDSEDGKYDVDFTYNNTEYSYEINAVTGAVIEYVTEPADIDDDADDDNERDDEESGDEDDGDNDDEDDGDDEDGMRVNSGSVDDDGEDDTDDAEDDGEDADDADDTDDTEDDDDNDASDGEDSDDEDNDGSRINTGSSETDDTSDNDDADDTDADDADDADDTDADDAEDDGSDDDEDEE